jgi:moderate conductance mechanosensitive channel
MPRPRRTVWCDRLVLPLLLVICVAAVPAAAAQGRALQSGAAQPALSQPDAAPSAPVSSAELEGLVRQLQDPTARARLVAELNALIAAERAAAPAPPTAPTLPGRQAAAPPAQQAAALLGRFWQRLDIAAGEIVAGAAVIVDAPRLYGWAREQIVDAAARRRWIEAGFAFVLVFGPAIAAEAILRRILARAAPRIPARRGDSRLLRAMFALFSLVFDALPIGVFAAAAYLAVSLMPDGLTAARITLAVLVEATVEARLALCIARSLLVPANAGVAPLPIEPDTRKYLYVWLRRFIVAGFYGYAIPEAGWGLGIPGALYALLLKAAGLVLAALAIVFVLQIRATVARRLAGATAAGSGWGRLRRGFGEVWHLLAIPYIVGLYLIYALHIAGGFVYVLRASLLSLVIILAARLLVRSIGSLCRPGVILSPELAAKLPSLERRTNRYLPVVGRASEAAVYGLAGLAVLRAWGVAAFSWLETGLGRAVAWELLSTGLILALALAAWEVLDAAIERYLDGLAADGPARRTRLPTLLPILRTAALGVFVVLIGLIILSHIGINIAPLLAGAGIVGVAIGFGSQTLVKDVITGLFILVEDQFAVGDVVDVGNGHSGVIEAISIRTVRLRDQAGTVHTVPFSSVTTVKNLTRDFAFVVARITIAYREDIDRVVAILREVCDKLTEDEALRPLILDPFDYQGVDSLDEFWVTLQLRIRTVPMQQWTVGRAFNRLVKIAFEEQGIATRDPNPIMLAGPGATAAVDAGRDAALERRRA